MEDKRARTTINRREFVGLGATAVFLAGWVSKGSGDAFADEEDSILHIVHTNDIHGNVAVLPYVKGLMDRLYNEGKNAILISAGDDFRGTPFADLSAGQDVVTAMNLSEYDLMAIGNHEYYMSAGNLNAAIGNAEFTMVACNQALDGSQSNTSLVQPYEIVEVGETKIAFIGIGYSPERWTQLTCIN